eukprot:1723337-Prymnesium_polylepis.1
METSISYYSQYNYIRNQTPKPMPDLEAVTSSAVKAVIDMQACVIVVFTNHITPAQLLAKYRPPVPIMVITTNQRVAEQTNVIYGCVPLLFNEITDCSAMLPAVYKIIAALGIATLTPGDNMSDQVVVVQGRNSDGPVNAEDYPNMMFSTEIVGDEMCSLVKPTGYSGDHTLTCTSTKVGLDLVCEPIDTPRKTKILCTMGPKCWSEE